MPKPLLLGDEYVRCYGGKWTRPTGNSFRNGLLTDAGVRVLDDLIKFAGGRKPDFRGCAPTRGTVAFTWAVPKSKRLAWDYTGLIASIDFLQEQGYAAEVETREGDRTNPEYARIGRRYWRAFERWPTPATWTRSLSSERKGIPSRIKVTYVKVKILNGCTVVTKETPDASEIASPTAG